MAKLNPGVLEDAQEEAMKKVLRTDSPNLFQNNYAFYKYLKDGVDVEYWKGDRIAGNKIWLMEHQGLICIKTEGDHAKYTRNDLRLLL
jgi:type I restriction enzyme R subunit